MQVSIFFDQQILTIKKFPAITFPKILVCSNSMHSRYKLQVFYPQLNSSMIEKFYGNYDEINSIKKLEILNLIKENVSQVMSVQENYSRFKRLDDLQTSDWDDFNLLNISELFRRTSPR